MDKAAAEPGTRQLVAAFRLLFAPLVQLYPVNRSVPRLAVLDGLRGLAACLVLVHHYQHFSIPLCAYHSIDIVVMTPLSRILAPVYRFGDCAVQLFWLISGFVFAAVYYGRGTSTREFAVNRFARLYPLHFVTLVLVAAEQWAAWLRFGCNLLYTDNDRLHFVLHLFFASNWPQSFDLSFNGPIWSVSVEVLIYALFWVSRRWVATYGFIGPLAFAAAMGAWQLVVGDAISSCGFHFFIGVALCGLWRAFERLPKLTSAVGSGMVLAGMLAISVVPAQHGVWHGMILRPLLMAGMVLAAAGAEGFAPAWLKRPLGALGDRTYSIYLVHVPIQLMVFLLLGSTVADHARHSWFLFAFIGLVMLVAWPCYRWLEAPARDWLRQYARPAQRVAAE